MLPFFSSKAVEQALSKQHQWLDTQVITLQVAAASASCTAPVCEQQSFAHDTTVMLLLHESRKVVFAPAANTVLHSRPSLEAKAGLPMEHTSGLYSINLAWSTC